MYFEYTVVLKIFDMRTIKPMRVDYNMVIFNETSRNYRREIQAYRRFGLLSSDFWGKVYLLVLSCCHEVFRDQQSLQVYTCHFCKPSLGLPKIKKKYIYAKLKGDKFN